MRCHPHVTAIGATTCTGNPQQGRIFARLDRNTENTIYLTSPRIVVEVDFIYVHILGATLRKQLTVRVELHLACLGNGVCPKLVEVGGTFGICLYLLWRESCSTCVAILLALDSGFYIHTIETRLSHLAR